jgi:Dickkopf N-terminal cysteine-rich region
LAVAEGCVTDQDCADFEKGECGVGKCNANTGACFTSLDSTMCTKADPNNACDENDVCGQDGKCMITFKPKGTPCDDRRVCTTPDTCDGKGVCVGGHPENCRSVCRKVAETCGTVAQCCSYANKVCEGPVGGAKTCQVCHALNTPCSRSSQCCSPANKACDGPSRATRKCKVCLVRRARCTRTSQCCPGLTCKSASSSKRSPALFNATSDASSGPLCGTTSAGSPGTLCGGSLMQCLP